MKSRRPAGAASFGSRWPGLMPWLASLSAHAALLAVVTGWLPPNPPQLLAAAPPALTVLGLPGDAPAVLPAANPRVSPAPAPRLQRLTGAAAARPQARTRVDTPVTVAEPEPLPLLLASASPVAMPLHPTLTAQDLASAVQDSRATPIEAPAPVASTSPPGGASASPAAPAARSPTPVAPASAAEDLRVVPVAYLITPAPAYPDAARRAGVEGLVRLRALVGPDGRAEELRVLSSSGSPELDAAALSGVSRWRFRPAQRGSRQVAAWLDIPVRFALDTDAGARR